MFGTCFAVPWEGSPEAGLFYVHLGVLMKTREVQTLKRTVAQMLTSSSCALLLVSTLWGLVACTSTQSEPAGFQDGAFASVTYDRERDETDVALRSLEESSGESNLQNVLRRDFYLPAGMLRSLTKRADSVREKIKNQSAADSESLRVLATDALVSGQPEMVEGYIRFTKNLRKRKLQVAEDQLLLGIASGLQGDIGKARGLLSEASQQSVTAAAARANLGLLALRQGSTLEALEFFRQAESLEPRNSRLAHLVAEAAYGSRKYPLALETYKKIVSRDENDLLAHYNLGLVYLYGSRSYKDARKQFRMVMDHPQVSRELRSQADGAFASVRREEEGSYGLATTELK